MNFIDSLKLDGWKQFRSPEVRAVSGSHQKCLNRICDTVSIGADINGNEYFRKEKLVQATRIFYLLGSKDKYNLFPAK